ncbi:MAG: hypothetical protein ACTH7Q_08085, partial [Pseudoalteromonas sp.]
MPQTQISPSLTNEQRQQNKPLVKCFIANQDKLKSFFCRGVGEGADADDLFQKLLGAVDLCSTYINQPTLVA